jgi:poly(hydroxyalkanoate) depolymerase family esterase
VIAGEASEPAAAAAPRPAPAKARVRRVAPSRAVVSPLMSVNELRIPGLDALSGRTSPLRRKSAEVAGPGQWIAATHASSVGARDYKLYVPTKYNGQAMPLVVMLHGCTQSPDDFAAGTNMNVVAEAEGFLVAYPAQAAGANQTRCWNWFQPAHQARDGGEPALIAGITRQVMAEYNVDAGRVYVAGLSAGGAMAAIMGATYPDVYAAVGVHSGLAPGSARDLPSALQAMQRGGAGRIRLDEPVPLILFHGDCDSTVQSCNADHLVGVWTDATAISPAATASAVAVQRGQAPGGRAYTREIFADVNGRAIVESWTIHGAGHAWSGGRREGSYTDPAGPDASRELARFFSEHPHPSAAPPTAG